MQEEGEQQGEVGDAPLFPVLSHGSSVACATDSAPPSLQFDEQSGHHLQLPSNPEPIHFVSNFLDHDILGHAVDETNR